MFCMRRRMAARLRLCCWIHKPAFPGVVSCSTVLLCAFCPLSALISRLQMHRTSTPLDCDHRYDCMCSMLIRMTGFRAPTVSQNQRSNTTAAEISTWHWTAKHQHCRPSRRTAASISHARAAGSLRPVTSSSAFADGGWARPPVGAARRLNRSPADSIGSVQLRVPPVRRVQALLDGQPLQRMDTQSIKMSWSRRPGVIRKRLQTSSTCIAAPTSAHMHGKLPTNCCRPLVAL